MINKTSELPSINHLTPNLIGYRLVESKFDDDCGCLEEEWECPIGSMFFHLRPSGFAEVYFDSGDAEWEIQIQGDDADGFWQQLQNYINTLPVVDDQHWKKRT